MDISREQVQQMIEQAVQAGITAARNENQYHLNDIDETLDKHEHLLYGNGREGIITKLDRIERAVTAAQDVGTKIITALLISGVVGLIILLARFNLLRP